jgi:hypothetical protein
MTDASSQGMSKFIVPTDAEVLKAIAIVTLRHNQLDHMLKYVLKSIAAVTIEEAFDATLHDGSWTLRERLRKLARRRLGDGTALVKFQALLGRCERATEKRNDLVHSVWEQDASGGETRVRDRNSAAKAPPTAEELNALGEELHQLAFELNEARLGGFLSEALEAKKPV